MFRYRGYYYDAETGFYYLNSRYYNPEWGRFISADTSAVLTATPMALTDKNLFAYCDNNPVMRRDDGGQWWTAICAVVGGIVGGVTQVVSNVATGRSWNEGIFGAVAGGVVFGAIMGSSGNLVAASYASAAAEAAINSATEYNSTLAQANGISTTREFTVENVCRSFADGLIETWERGTVTAMTGKVAGKIIPINNGWFKPQKLVSCLTGKYAQKSMGQSAVQGTLIWAWSIAKAAIQMIS